MTIPIRTGVRKLRDEGVGPFTARMCQYLSLPIWNTVTSRYPIGTNIFDREWDLLVVLDSGRVDAFREVAEETILPKEIKEIQSVGSASSEWTLQTFRTEYLEQIAKTALVSRNGWPNTVLKKNLTNGSLISRVRANADSRIGHQSRRTTSPTTSGFSPWLI